MMVGVVERLPPVVGTAKPGERFPQLAGKMASRRNRQNRASDRMEARNRMSQTEVSMVLAAMLAGVSQAEDGMEARARQFIAHHEANVRPLEVEVALRWWDANVSGKDEAFKIKQDAEVRLDLVLANKERFAELKTLHDAKLPDALLARQIHVLYLQHLAKQVPTALLRQMTAKANAVEQAFNTYRAKVQGKELTDSQVRRALKDSRDSAYLRAVWEASKGVGKVVENDLKTLVKLRNQAARELGYANFHVLQMTLNEQDQTQVIQLFDELDKLTRAPFHAAKQQMDQALAKRLGIAEAELRPWHYQDPFFQEPPAVFPTDLNAVFAKVDILKLCREFYAGIDLPIDDVITRSDLYEKPGKSPHAFCTDIDREGDVRVLANIVSDHYWMSTMLHELGHAVYSSKNIPRSVPYVLRGEAHILTTEGVAMMFERFAKSAEWLEAMGVKVADPVAFNKTGEIMRRYELLIFSRWCQVMLRFEKGLYENPDQDVNKLWWDLVEEYQELRRPEGRDAPDYASKIHVVVAPVYYHNYMMGELFACQLHAAITREVLKQNDPRRAYYVNTSAVGAFMKEKVFAPGRRLPWNALTQHATGAPLTPGAFADELRDD